MNNVMWKWICVCVCYQRYNAYPCFDSRCSINEITMAIHTRKHQRWKWKGLNCIDAETSITKKHGIVWSVLEFIEQPVQPVRLHR